MKPSETEQLVRTMCNIRKSSVSVTVELTRPHYYVKITNQKLTFVCDDNQLTQFSKNLGLF